MTERLLYAVAHATIGWGLVSLLCLLLRRSSPNLRCWAWRLALLKGPIALLFLASVAVPASTVFVPPYEPVAPILSAPRVIKTVIPVESRPLELIPIIYAAGVAATLILRLRPRSVNVNMPHVKGVIRPHIYLPAELRGDAATMALAHEEAHLRRRDPQWSLLADLCCAALWFSPATWLSARAMRAESEAACDAEAVARSGASPLVYARLLLSFAGPAPANALGAPARRLERRIKMLGNTPTPRSLILGAAVLALTTISLVPLRAESLQVTTPTGTVNSLPARISLDLAIKRLLADPLVCDKLNLTPAQKRAIAGEAQKIAMNRLVERQAAATRNLQKLGVNSKAPMAGATRAELRNVRADIDKLRGEIAQHSDDTLSQWQRSSLQAMAIDKFGSALWEDPQVAKALGLSSDQIAKVRSENDKIESAIETNSVESEFGRSAYQLQKKAEDPKTSGTERNGLLARAKFMRDINKRFHRYDVERSPTFWRMRGAADARLESVLDAGQISTLNALRSNPAAWPKG